MLSVDVRSNMAPFLAQMRETFKDGIPTATYRALNKVGDQAKTLAIREIRGTYRLKAKTVRDQFIVRKANSNLLTASVVASGRAIPLYAFNAKQVGSGVSVNVRGTKKVVEHAFIATIKNANGKDKVGVFMRQPGAKTKLIKEKRTALPINHLFAVSLPLAMANKAVSEGMVRIVGEKYPKIMIHEFERIAKQKGLM